MNIVYFCKLVDNIKNNINPKFYIGSKQNCNFNNGLIFDKHGKPYNTSSKYVNEYVKCGGNVCFDVICVVDNIDELLEIEQFYQKQYNAVSNIEFANMSYATTNNFVKSNYATVKNGNKFFRTHISNLSHYDGATKNYRWMNNGDVNKLVHPDEISDYLSNGFVFGSLMNICGENNPFYGKKHTQETIHRIKKSLHKFNESDAGIEFRKKHSEFMKRKMHGKCNYPDEARKRGLKKAHKFCKGKSRRQNIITGQMAYINTNEIELLNKKIWVTTEIYNVIKNGIIYECKHCGKTTRSKSNYERWHNDNCKLKKGKI